MSIFFKKNCKNLLFCLITFSLSVCSLKSECFASRNRLLTTPIQQPRAIAIVQEQQQNMIKEEQIDTILQKLGLITEQIQQLNSKFDNFTLEINSRLDKIDTRIDDSIAVTEELGHVLFSPRVNQD